MVAPRAAPLKMFLRAEPRVSEFDCASDKTRALFFVFVFLVQMLLSIVARCLTVLSIAPELSARPAHTPSGSNGENAVDGFSACSSHI